MLGNEHKVPYPAPLEPSEYRCARGSERDDWSDSVKCILLSRKNKRYLAEANYPNLDNLDDPPPKLCDYN